MKTSSERSRGSCFGIRARSRAWLVALTAIFAFAVTLSAQAQSPVDPPTRVARLSEADGQVWLYSPDNNEWISITRNRPLTTGDHIATDKNARAEVTLGTTTLRLDVATELEIVQLDDTHFQVRLDAGSIAARLRNPQSLAEFSLATDEGSFRTQAVGRYRFDRFDQASDVTVYDGRAVYEAGNTALPVSTGQRVRFWIDAAGVPQYAMQQSVRDGFASWNDERDRAEDSVATARYVSPEMTGADDLARYGSWEQTPEYGALWVPRAVPVGWAPYSAGHWAWIRPWGWTWVDDAPWGFAPFHYGRWVMRRNVWCWAPGTYVARPVYAPALVAWIGGPHVSVSVSVGGPAVGWFPLAPREVYVPAYHTSMRYVREVNITNVTNVTRITTVVNDQRRGEPDRRDFANRRFPHAVTFVPADVMRNRQPVAPSAERLRNDPRVRSLVAEASPAQVVTAPPLAAPPLTPRSQQGRPPPRPPFEARGPARSDRAEMARPPGGGESPRPEGVRAEKPPVSPGSTRPEDIRRSGNRPEPSRGGVAPPVVGASPSPSPSRSPAPAPDTGAKPVIGITKSGPPVGARGVVEPSNSHPDRRGTGGDDVAGQASRPQLAAPGSAQSNAPPGEAIGRPVPRGRDNAVGERGGPKQAAVPGMRNHVPRAVAPPVHEAAPAPQPAPAAAHSGEQRKTRPEPPRNREERKSEKRDDNAEKQR